VDAQPPLRIALVGAGRMGRTHLRAIAMTPMVEAAAVVVPNAEERAEFAAGGLAAYADVDELVESASFDAALIAAPSDVHLSLVELFATAGKPMLCEKPCGLRATDAAAAAAAAEAAGVVLQIGYWRRFVPELRALRDRVRAGDLGEVSLISCWQWDERPPAAAFRIRNGGILVDMGVHEFDQIRWLTGEDIQGPIAVPAARAEAAAAPDVDTAHVVAQLSGGGLGSISLGRRFPQGDCCWVEVMGTHGYARSLFMWGARGKHVFLAALVAQMEAFAAAVQGERLRGADGGDAVAALTLAEECRWGASSHSCRAGEVHRRDRRTEDRPSRAATATEGRLGST
jgi:myo-inositol 2-dehydrogenase / D-chiro-inositol 1-dehydrogenase